MNCGDPKYKTNVVLEWNTVVLETALVDTQLTDPKPCVPPPDQDGVTRKSRAIAIAHAAIYNAVVALSGKYEPYFDPDIPENEQALPPLPEVTLDLNVTVAAAAHRTLIELFPHQCERLDNLLNGYSRVLHDQNPPVDPQPSINFGICIGEQVLRSRDNDRYDCCEEYDRPMNDGIWRPDPLDPAQIPLDPHWGRVRPFALSCDEIQAVLDPKVVEKPPGYNAERHEYDLENNEYRQALDEVREVGELNAEEAANRTSSQTLNAVFWSYDEGRGTPIRLYNQSVRAIILLNDLDVVETARLLLLANIAMVDAGIGTWLVKYTYALWRPIHGVRLDSQAPDKAWRPLGKQPPFAPVPHCSPRFPAYTSGHAAFGGATFRILERSFGAKCRFELTSDEIYGYHLPDERDRERDYYEQFSEASFDNWVSRLYLGVHFRFDGDNGERLGQYVADIVFNRIAQPV